MPSPLPPFPLTFAEEVETSIFFLCCVYLIGMKTIFLTLLSFSSLEREVISVVLLPLPLLILPERPIGITLE